MTGELMIGIAEFRQKLQGNVKAEDVIEARRMLEGCINSELQAVKNELRGQMYEACPHEWKVDISTHLAFCKHCGRNNGLVETVISKQ